MTGKRLSKNLPTLNRVGASRRKLTTLTLVAANLLLPAAESAAQSSPRSSAKNYAAHLEALKEKAPPGFTIIVEKPFVVIGDESPDIVRKRVTGHDSLGGETIEERLLQQGPR